MLETILHKFYAASITIGADGSLLVTGTRDRILAWGMAFCIIAAGCLVSYLVFRKKLIKRIALGSFVISLLIPVLIMPSVKQEYILISPQQITVEKGYWYMPSRTVHQFRGINRIREVTNGVIPANFVGDRSVDWYITQENGINTVLELNDFFNAHRMVAAYYFIDRGFYVERLEDRLSLQ